MAAVEIQLFGRFSVRRSGEEIPPGRFGGRLVRVLVRFLVTRRGGFVSRDVLAEALWPERMPADPTANLWALIRRARAALGDPGLIVTGPGGYSFAGGEACVIDTEVFLAAVQAGQDHLAAGRAAAALGEFRSALERWAGEPLAEDAYEAWAQELRAVLTRAYLLALEGAGEAALALGEPSQAVVLAERAVAREPLREPAALLLARALVASGDLVAALRTIDSLRRRIAEEAGLELSSEAVALETRLQRGEPVPGTARPPAVAPLRPAFEGLAFVGRDEQLAAVLAEVGGAEPGTVLVAGAAGAGKSRLLAEAAARSALPVLALRAFLPERNEPWSLARELLREALTLDLGAAGAVPARAVPALADVLPELGELRPVPAVEGDPESRRALALEGAARVMATAAAKGALVVVDDLQWADATSLAVLGLVARRVPQAAMALAYRPEEVAVDAPVSTFLEELRVVRGPLMEITVGPLRPEAISLLVADEAVAAALAEATDRTPLAIAEAIRSLSADGILALDAGGRWDARRPDAAHRAREVARSGQRRAIASRADRQPPERRQLLSLLALVNREAPARVLAQAPEASEATLLDDLEALARAGLVRLGEAGWATAHDLIGEVVAECLDRAERGRLHHLLGRAVQAEGGDPAEVARHLLGAGDRAAAAAAFSEAARQRLSAFAGDEARELAETGLVLDPSAAVRTALLRTRAEARALTGDLAGAREDLRAALASIPRGPERTRTLIRVSDFTQALDGYAQAAEVIEVALAEAGDDAARAEALTLAAFFDVNRMELDRAEARATAAQATFEQLGEPAGVASVVGLRGLVAYFRGQLMEAADLYGRAGRLFRDSGRLLKVGTMRAMQGRFLILNGRAEEGLSEIGGALELERALGHTEGEAFSLCFRGEALCVLGRLEEAERDARTALEICRALGNREWVSVALKTLAACRQASGDLESAEAALREAMEVVPGIAIQVEWSAALLASVLVEKGDLERAEGYAQQGRESGFAVAHFEAGLVLAEIALARGDPEGPRLAAEALSATKAAGYRCSPARKRLEAKVLTS